MSGGSGERRRAVRAAVRRRSGPLRLAARRRRPLPLAVAEFARAVGPLSADVLDRSFAEVARAYRLDPEGSVGRLLERRDTWSGRTVFWPVQNAAMRAPVDLAALPVYARDRSFDGFRGFGIVRLADSAADPDALGLSLARALAGDPAAADMRRHGRARDVGPSCGGTAPASEHRAGYRRRRFVRTPRPFRAARRSAGDRGGAQGHPAGRAPPLEGGHPQPCGGGRLPRDRRAPGRQAQPARSRRGDPAGIRPYRGDRGGSHGGSRRIERGRRTPPVRPRRPTSRPATRQEPEPAPSTGRRRASPAAERRLAEAPTSEGRGRAAAEDGGAQFGSALERIYGFLPIPILVRRRDELVYANREFLDLTGYADLAAVVAAGGLDALVCEPDAAKAPTGP